MYDVYRVYDKRTDETLFTSKFKSACIRYIAENYDESHEAWDYVFIDSLFTKEDVGE